MKITDLPVITSKDNPKLKQARATRDGREKGLIFVEGARLVTELLRSQVKPRTVLASQSSADKLETLLRRLKGDPEVETHLVSPSVFKSIIDTEHSQGIIVLADRPERREISEVFSMNGLVVFLHEAANPSNLGAVIRTAEAAGVAALILSPGSTDPYSPKALRASMGSAFRHPICTNVGLSEAIAIARECRIGTVASEVHGGKRYTEADLRGPKLLVFGSEAHGLDREYLELIDEKIFIPMENEVESLNLAVSAGILLFEAKRQREIASFD